MIKSNTTKLLCYAMLPIAFMSLQRFNLTPIKSTGFWWLMQFIVLAIFLIGAVVYYKPRNQRLLIAFNLYMLWTVISIVRGVFIAETYWDWKGLTQNTFAILLPIVVYSILDEEVLQSVLSFYIKITIPILMLSSISIPLSYWTLFLYPTCFLLLFLPVLNTKWKVILLIFVIISLIDIGGRATVVKYCGAFLLMTLFYVQLFISTENLIKIVWKFLLFLPWFLFVLAVTGLFNVFNFKDDIKTDKVIDTKYASGEIRQQDLTDDSRTWMYIDVINSAQKYNYWLLGRSPARGNETDALSLILDEITGRKERLKNEANVPNVFTWMGVIGLLLYFMVFYRASYLAVYKSNSIYIKIVGLYTAFRWLIAWAEDPYTFSTNNLTIWILWAVCYSPSFRTMNNMEIQIWVRGIFNKKYMFLYKYIKQYTNAKVIKLDSYQFGKRVH